MGDGVRSRGEEFEGIAVCESRDGGSGGGKEAQVDDSVARG